jgi:O-antigen ligase
MLSIPTESPVHDLLPGGVYTRAAWWLLLLFVATIPAEAALVIPGYGSLARIVGAALLVIVALDLSSPDRDWPGGLAMWCTWGFSAWAFLTIAWSLDPRLSVVQAVTYFQLALMFSVLVSYANSCDRVIQLLQAYLVGAVVTAIFVFIQFRAINFAALAITDVRVSAFGYNPNEQGLTLVAALPWALYTARFHARQLVRVAALAAVAGLALATVLTASRGAFIALALTALGMLWMLVDARRSTKLLVCLTAAAAALVAYGLIPDLIWARLFTVTENLQSMDLNARLPAWRGGVQYYIDSPIGGIGAGAFEAASARVISVERSSHNSFLGILVETGLVGACLFGTLLTCVIRSAIRLPATLRRAVLTTLVPMLVGMLVTAWDYRKVPWLFFALTIALWRAQRSAPSNRD